MQRLRFLWCVCLLLSGNPASVFARQPVMYRYIDINAKRLVFTCGDQLWVTNRRGAEARLLPVDQTGIENPLFSPGGRFIAYSAVTNGNTDVYVLSVSGGEPRRLTWHPGRDRFRSWNGNRIIYSSAKAAAPARYTELYEIDLLTGTERKLPFTGSYCQISPDSSYTAIVAAEDIMETGAFRLYRGGNNCRIEIRNNRTGNVQELLNQGGNDLNPVWSGQTLYFISDRDGARNLYGYDLQNGSVNRFTDFHDFDIHCLSVHGRSLAFEQGGRLFLLDVVNGKLESFNPKLPEDNVFPGKQPYTLTGRREMRSVSISPDGNRLVLDYHGDVLMAQSDGTAKSINLTSSTGTHEQQPACGPDGRIAYLSDVNGEYQLVVQAMTVLQTVQRVSLGKGYFSELRWSPDGKKIAFCDHLRRLLILDLASEKVALVATDSFSVRNENQFNCHWSPDSRLLVYQLRGKNQLNRVVIYHTFTGKKDTLTDGSVDACVPVFDRTGKRLYFGVCRENSLAMGELDMSAFGRTRSWEIYTIDISHSMEFSRPRKLSGGLINLRNLEVTKTNNLFFIAEKDGVCLMTCDTKTGKTAVIRPRVNDFQFAVESDQLFCKSDGDYWILNASAPYTARKIDLSALTMTVDPVAEWRNVFEETLRLIRDFFRGSRIPDIGVLRKKYEPWLSTLTCREDFKYLLRQLLGELQSSHVFFSSPEGPAHMDEAIGLLGANWEIDNGYYRLKKIYHGNIWGNTAQNPFDDDSVSVSEGDYLVSVNGIPVKAGIPVEAYFNRTAGKPAMLGFNKRPFLPGERVFNITPLDDDADLRRWRWAERNRFLIDSLSKGRAGYIYLSDTHWPAYQAFNRDYASQAEKDYLVIDARFNAGGYFPDYLVDMLARKPRLKFLRNDALPFTEPLMAAPLEIMLLVNQRTVSGGELLAAQFRQYRLGLIVGARTAGLSNPYTCDHQLLDGTTLVSPTLELADLHDQRIIENHGLVPDVIIPGDPGDAAGESQLLRSLIFLLSNPQ